MKSTLVTRRRALASGLVVLGGGSAIAATAFDEQPGETVDPAPRVLSEANVYTVGWNDLEGTVSITEPRIDATTTATIELSLTWNGDSPLVIGVTGNIPFGSPQFDSTEGMHKSKVCLIHESEAESIDRRTENVWVPKSSNEFSTLLGLSLGRFHPGETRTGSRQLWGDPQHAEYIEPGFYRFISTVTHNSERAETGGGNATTNGTPTGRGHILLTLETQKKPEG